MPLGYVTNSMYSFPERTSDSEAKQPELEKRILEGRCPSFLLPELTKSASGGKDRGRRARLKAGFPTVEPVPPLPSPGSSQRMKPCTPGLQTYSKDRHMLSLHLSGHEQLLNNVPENTSPPNASVSLGSG